MPVIKLTQKILPTLTCPPNKARIEYCDQELPGLYLEVRASNPAQPTWYLRYKNAAGKTQHQRVGPLALVNIAEARKEATRLKAELLKGNNPRELEQQRRSTPTLRQFVEEHYVPYGKHRKKSFKDDMSRLNYRLLPKFGDLKMHEITRKMLVDFQNELADANLKPASINHHMKLVRYLWNLGRSWGLLHTENPASGLPMLPERNRVEHYLTEEQLERLLTVLHTHPNRLPCQVCLFLLSSGLRLNEALTATWEQVDWEQRTLKLYPGGNKSGKMRLVPLGEAAMAVLEELKPEVLEGPVFRNPRSGERLKGVNRAWMSIKKQAGVEFLRLHDLRHNFSALLLNEGVSLVILQHCLGHSSPSITMRYAHLSTKTLQDAVAKADGKLLNGMRKQESASSNP